MSEITEPVYHDYPYSPFMESFIKILLKILKVILGILGVFAWCFLCFGIFGLSVYLYERRRNEHGKVQEEDNNPS